MLGLLLMAAAISAPATARGMHGFSHAGAPIASGEHHHHDADGKVTMHGDVDENAPQSDDSPIGQVGHSHMAGAAFDVLPQVGRDLPKSASARGAAPMVADTPALGTLGWTPQIRPPRTA